MSRTLAALKGEQSTNNVLTDISRRVQKVSGPLIAYLAALVDVLQQQPSASTKLLNATRRAMAEDAEPWRWSNVVIGVANIARIQKDADSELAARQAAVEVLRQAVADVDGHRTQRAALYGLAALYFRRKQYDAVVPIMEEIVVLGEEHNAPHVESDRAALEIVRMRMLEAPGQAVRDHIHEWKQGSRSEVTLSVLLDLIARRTVAVLRSGDPAAREDLAEDLALLRGVQPLPIEGTHAFLHLLQCWLRHEPDMEEQIARLRPNLSLRFYEMFQQIRQQIRQSPTTTS
ncbi:MAG: hypothetical protein HC837_20875 [Chloroflexaceae bacterium]|nr:hypothetical protein [Chloroflexaceae bacterium]